MSTKVNVNGQEVEVPEGMTLKSAETTVNSSAANQQKTTASTSPISGDDAGGTTAPVYNKIEYTPQKLSYVDGPSHKPYTEIFSQLVPKNYVPMTPEQKRKLIKRQQSKAIIGAIGDGISAMSNLYYTSRDALNAYDPKNSLSERMQARRDQLEKERKDNERWYMKAMMDAQGKDDDNYRWKTGLNFKVDSHNAGEDYRKYKADQHAADKLFDSENNRFSQQQKLIFEREKMNNSNKQQAANRAVKREEIRSRRPQEIRIKTSENGVISVPREMDNDVNWGNVFASTPKGRQMKYDPRRDKGKVSTTDMQAEIGKAIEAGDMVTEDAFVRTFKGNNVHVKPQVRTIVKKGGKYETTYSPVQNDNTPPSRISNDNTPPSRR